MRDQLDSLREQMLVTMAQRGRREAFHGLVERYERRLLYFVRRLVGDGDESLDVLQEVWLTVFRRIHTLHAPQAFRAWLYRIARDKAIDALRKRDRHRELLVEMVEELLPSTAEEPADLLLQADDAERVHLALERLAPIQREVLTLRFLESMSLEEIAQVIGCPVGTVKSRLFHAKSRMQATLAEPSHA